MKKTILIFGATSFIGSNLLEYLKRNFRVIGTYFQTSMKIPGVTTLPCDVLNKENVAMIVSRTRPDFILYAVGLSSIYFSERYPKMADDLNSTGAINCAMMSDRYGSKFVYFSSGFVFKSQNKKLQENEIPLAESIYGKTVLSMELHLQRSCMNYLIFRCAPIFGHSFHPLKPSWFDRMQEQFLKAQSFPMDDQLVTGFLDVGTLGSLISLMLERAGEERSLINRIFQVSSSDFMTRYEFAKTYAELTRNDQSLPLMSRMELLSQKTRLRIVKDQSDHEKETGKKKSIVEKKYFCLDASNLEKFLNVEMPTISDCIKKSISY